MNIILFDGICNLCNGTVSFIVKRDKRKLFRFVSLQSEAGKTLLDRYAVESSNKTLYYFRKGDCYSKSTAILYILKDLGGLFLSIDPDSGKSKGCIVFIGFQISVSDIWESRFMY